MPLRKKERRILADEVTLKTRGRYYYTLPPNWSSAGNFPLSAIWPERLISEEKIEYDVLPGYSLLAEKRKKMRLTKKTMYKFYRVYPFDLPSGNCAHTKVKTFESSIMLPDPTHTETVLLANGNLVPSAGHPAYTSYGEESKAYHNSWPFEPLGSRNWVYKRASAKSFMDACAPRLDDWCQRAFDGCCDILQHQGNFASKPEMAQFLIEMRQLKSTFQALRSPLRALSTLSSDLTKKGLRSFFRTIASQHLNIAFNVLPNIGDIKSAYKAIGQFADSVRNIELHANEDLVYHWRPPKDELPVVDWSYDFSRMVPRNDSAFAQFGQASEYMYNTVNPVNVTIHYSYSLPSDFASTKTQLLLMMDALGINRNPKIIWDEIPFSFVVDWFLRIGDWLEDNFAKRNVEFPVIINDCCITYKCAMLYAAYGQVVGFSGPTYPLTREGWNRVIFTSAGTQTNSAFIRRRWCPLPGWISLRAGQPGINQILLGTSLITVNCL